MKRWQYQRIIWTREAEMSYGVDWRDRQRLMERRLICIAAAGGVAKVMQVAETRRGRHPNECS